MADDEDNVWSPTRTREFVVLSNCDTFTSQRSRQDIKIEMDDSSRKAELSNRFGIFDNEIVLTGRPTPNENITNDVNATQSVEKLSLSDCFQFHNSSCSGTSTLNSALRHMQITNKSTVHMKPKKKPGNKLFPVKKNLNKLFLLKKLELLGKNESVLPANQKTYD